MLSRRHFIQSIPILVGLCYLPKTIYDKPNSAINYLTKLYDQHVKERGLLHSPRFIYSGEALFTQFEQELPIFQRFSCSLEAREYKPNLSFKLAKYTYTDKLAPYEVIMSKEPIVNL